MAGAVWGRGGQQGAVMGAMTLTARTEATPLSIGRSQGFSGYSGKEKNLSLPGFEPGP